MNSLNLQISNGWVQFLSASRGTAFLLHSMGQLYSLRFIVIIIISTTNNHIMFDSLLS